jgi:hypothetical protein
MIVSGAKPYLSAPQFGERLIPVQTAAQRIGGFVFSRTAEARLFGGAEPDSPAGAHREWKIEDRFARSVMREMTIGENYERKPTPSAQAPYTEPM